MAEETFNLVYEGPAVDTGSMDVRQLAPALLALGELYQEAQRLLYPDERPLALEVRATTEGSFDVHLVLTQSLWQQAVSLFSGDDATAIGNLLAFGTALGGLLIALHRKRSKSRAQMPDGMIRITFDDGTVLEVPAEVLTLAESMTVRKAYAEVVAPLNVEGIDAVRFTSQRTTDLVITKQDVRAFDLPPTGDELLSDSVRSEVLSISSVAFTDGNKWRLTDGERTFFAAVNDTSFLDRVASDEVRFAKHDLLRVDLRVQQWRTDGGLRTEYTVEHVADHIPAARPIPLPFDQQSPFADEDGYDDPSDSE